VDLDLNRAVRWVRNLCELVNASDEGGDNGSRGGTSSLLSNLTIINRRW